MYQERAESINCCTWCGAEMLSTITACANCGEPPPPIPPRLAKAQGPVFKTRRNPLVVTENVQQVLHPNT